MKVLAFFLAAALLPAQTPIRRAIAPSPTNGWARVVVDDDGAEGVWIGDAEGRSVPFLWESDAKWSAIPLRTLHPVFGKDAQGHPTAAFTLHAPEGFSRGDREQVKLDFALEASATPWTCRVEIARRGDGGAFITLDDESRFLYDFGSDRRATSLTIPWDADDYRVTLLPVQGKAPRLTRVSASAITAWWMTPTRSVEMRLGPPEERTDGVAQPVALPRVGTVTGLEINLVPPVAPVSATVEWTPWRKRIHSSFPPQKEPGMVIEYNKGVIWNLPALGTQQTLLPLPFIRMGGCLIVLPKEVRFRSVRALMRDPVLFFPAETGQSYFLHSGGLTKSAPGSLSELPASSRAFYAGAPLALGPPEPDPQAVTPVPDPVARLRRALPWGVGLLILLLGFWGFRLLKAPGA